MHNDCFNSDFLLCDFISSPGQNRQSIDVSAAFEKRYTISRAEHIVITGGHDEDFINKCSVGTDCSCACG